jgi:hypothetical protein
MIYRPGCFAGVRDIDSFAAQLERSLPEPAIRVSSGESLATPTPTAGDRFVDWKAHNAREPHSAGELACAELASLFPDAHILIVTRGFAAIMLSSYSQYVRMGGIDPFFALNPDFGAPHHRSRGVWHYDRLIAAYRAAFGGRVLALPYELLRDDPAAFTATIERRFGLPAFPGPRKAVNRALGPAELAWYPRLTRAIGRLPVGRHVREILLRRHIQAMEARRLRGAASVLQRLRPLPPVGSDMISDRVLEHFRGKAECLRDDPLYQPYRADYLL